MNIKTTVLAKATKWLVGGELFSFIQEEVLLMMDADIPSGEKRARVYAKAQRFFAGTLNVFINIAIEVAVAWAKSKSPQGLK